MGLFCTGSFPDYETAFAKAEESLDSGMAYQSFKKLIALQS
jgi:anthranilate phosphoribosyltransferase